MALSDTNLTTEISISADYNQIRTASAWVAQTCLAFSIPSEQINRLDICLNEVLANIIDHGGEGAKSSSIKLQLQMNYEAFFKEVNITVCDAGMPFNPLELQQKVRPYTLENTEPGGLGLTMIRHFVDQLSYHYSNGLNQLSFSVRWETI